MFFRRRSRDKHIEINSLKEEIYNILSQFK